MKLLEKYNIKYNPETIFFQLTNDIEIKIVESSILKSELYERYPVETLESILKFKLNRNAEKDQKDIENIRIHFNVN